MIEGVIWFVAGCLAARAALSALKLDKAVAVLACGGIPFHELSHVVACLALGIRVTSVTLLRVDGRGSPSGAVEHRGTADPYASFLVTVAPAVGALFWCWLLAWGAAAVCDAGHDVAWAWLFLYLAAATGTRSAPSAADWRVAGGEIARRPGRFLAGLGGSAAAGLACWACGFPLAEWWHLLLLVIAVAVPGVVLSKLHGRWRGDR
ncbi:MAG: hypothetical protein JXR94_06020 [Candidatus Hydrogenedentes bacterium]|nr:hypothetical protein [Candidatus Hydrogenedentota bacterium]